MCTRLWGPLPISEGAATRTALDSLADAASTSGSSAGIILKGLLECSAQALAGALI